jgi:patatin-like phospholipase/acyl hydrolase
MPIDNFSGLHFTGQEMQDVDTALQTIEDIIRAKSKNFTPDERQKYGSINEQNKLLVNKVLDYQKNQPQLASTDVDWKEYNEDFSDRSFLDTRLNRLEGIQEMMNDTKIAHDFDNYQAALTDYDYTKYKASTNAPGFGAKAEDLKQFFPGGGTKPAAPTP